MRTCTEEELWKYVAGALAESGVDVILVGGAVVSVYSKGAYKSGDLDFVTPYNVQDSSLAMELK